MRMIISPAKKMRTDPDGLAAVGLPRFRDKAERVKQALQRLTAEELPFIVGVDATPPALDAMEEGALKGTVQNDAAGQARALVELACALACGEKPEGAVELTDGKYVWLSYATVTQDNLADFRSS